MKIYVGKNKKKAVKITLKDLFFLCIKSDEKMRARQGRLSDDSASYVEIRQTTPEKNAVVDISIGFDPDTDNDVIDITAWKSMVIIDEENMKKIV